jgi:hypothetical protein
VDLVVGTIFPPQQCQLQIVLVGDGAGWKVMVLLKVISPVAPKVILPTKHIYFLPLKHMQVLPLKLIPPNHTIFKAMVLRNTIDVTMLMVVILALGRIHVQVRFTS